MSRWLVMLLGILLSGLVVASLAYLPFNEILPREPEERLRDWRTYFLSPHAARQRQDIAVILITEDSLKRYRYRSPVDRALLATVIDDLNKAGVAGIGLDFIFDRASDPDKDDMLLNAIRSSRVPIVLGQIDERATKVKNWSLTYHNKFLKDAGRPTGHLFFGATGERLAIGDDVIRRIVPQGGFGSTLPSFARVLAELDGRKPQLSSSHISWLRPPAESTAELFATLLVPVHEPLQQRRVTATPQLLQEFLLPLLKGKIVLVGGDLYDTDQHFTPLSVISRQRVPGVMVHAQILAQIRDGRAIHELSQKTELISAGFLTFAGFLLGWRYRLHLYDLVIGILGTGIMVGLGALAFWFMHLIVPYTLLTAWLIGLIGGHLVSHLKPNEDHNERRAEVEQ